MAGLILEELERVALPLPFTATKAAKNPLPEKLDISQRGLWNKLQEYGLSQEPAVSSHFPRHNLWIVLK